MTGVVIVGTVRLIKSMVAVTPSKSVCCAFME